METASLKTWRMVVLSEGPGNNRETERGLSKGAWRIRGEIPWGDADGK